MPISDNLKHIQSIRGVTTDELAELSGVPASTITKIRSRVTLNPNADTLQRLAKALNCSINDLTDTPSVDEGELRDLLPKTLPTDPEAMLELFLGTLKNQRLAMDRSHAELRKDRNFWRKMCIIGLGALLPLAVFTAVMVCVLYWDLSHPMEGNIIWSAVNATVQNMMP